MSLGSRILLTHVSENLHAADSCLCEAESCWLMSLRICMLLTHVSWKQNPADSCLCESACCWLMSLRIYMLVTSVSEKQHSDDFILWKNSILATAVFYRNRILPYLYLKSNVLVTPVSEHPAQSCIRAVAPCSLMYPSSSTLLTHVSEQLLISFWGECKTLKVES